MLRSSIRTKILGIAVGLIVLMVGTAALSLVAAMRVGNRLEQLSADYFPAYHDLSDATIDSLDRALEVRRMIVAKTATPPDNIRYAESIAVAEAKLADIDREERAAGALIQTMIENTEFSDTIALTRVKTLLDTILTDDRRYLANETKRLLSLLDAGNTEEITAELERVEGLRDELTRKMNAIRSEMLTLVQASTATTLRKQRELMIGAAALTALATILGLAVSLLVSAGMMRPVRRLLEGTRAIEAGHLDQMLQVTSRDEIGVLTGAFNRMVEQLRLKERIRETFGKYIDPQVVEGLIDRPALATSGQRRIMTTLFCDLVGFTSISEWMTPQGLVKIMNRYLSTMSGPIRIQHGVIDKHIGDAIMAYWGPPFNDDADQARLACLAALDMVERVAPLCAELPEILGVRNLPPLDIRIGIAAGEALVGTIGSELMMSYTIMGDSVNLASRLEGANKVYATRVLASEATAKAAVSDVEVREIDRVVVLGQKEPQAVFEVMARKDQLTTTQAELCARFTEALAAYRARQWEAARRGFVAALAVVPNDGPSLTLLKRLDALQASNLAEDWDGAWHLDQK
jgi:class 3 adenylate cyclase